MSKAAETVVIVVHITGETRTVSEVCDASKVRSRVGVIGASGVWDVSGRVKEFFPAHRVEKVVYTEPTEGGGS